MRESSKRAVLAPLGGLTTLRTKFVIRIGVAIVTIELFFFVFTFILRACLFVVV